MAKDEITQLTTLDKVLSLVPSEMLYEIFANLSFVELLDIFTLNKEIYNLLIESEYFFEKLCLNYCKIHNVESFDYLQIVHNLKEKKIQNKNFYLVVMTEMITCFGYTWDTDFVYYKTENDFELTSTTLKAIKNPLHGDFYTVKANRLLKPGRFYKWKIKLDEYIPEGVGNSFKVMIGIESLGFFPFKNQSSGDVIGWQSNSKGVALIIGTGDIIKAACKSSDKGISTKEHFETGDIIQVEFDFKHVPQHIEPFEPTGEYSSTSDKEEYMGSVRFSLIRDGQIKELIGWIPYGDVRFAPYVPAVSVNKAQTISFVH